MDKMEFILSALAIIVQAVALNTQDDIFNPYTFGISKKDGAARMSAFNALRFEDPVASDVTLELDTHDGVVVEDMLLTQDQYDNYFKRSKDHSRKLVNVLGKPEFRWPDGDDGWPEIPYTTSVPRSIEDRVNSAIKYWHKHTCVKFKPATNLKRPYVGIQPYGGCASRVGRVRRAAQLLGLASTCSLGSAIHELGHTLGFFHEHQRYDREEYINVNNHNVKDSCGGRLRGCDPNFEEKTKSDMFSFDVRYDLGSIMHYGPKMFTKSTGEFTLSAKDGDITGVLGQRSRLSHRDIHLINKAYSCTPKWLALCAMTKDPCLNEGYTGANCKCICPPGTSGSLCQYKTGDYYDNVKPRCNRHIKSPTTISATHDDVHKLPDDVVTPAAWCVFTIEAPPCHKPEITIRRFHMPDMYWRTKVKCKYAWVEFKEHYQTNGKMYCGTELKYGQKIIGASHKMSIFFHVASSLRGYFQADIKFIKDEQCGVMMDEALASSPFNEPIISGNCLFGKHQNGFVWRSHNKGSEMCTFFFTEEPEPFALRLEFTDKNGNTNNKKCHHYIRYCYNEDKCSVLNSDKKIATIPSSSAVFEYVPDDSSCSFEFYIVPEQSYCQKIMMVDSGKNDEVLIIDKKDSHCEIWCKTMENRQVRVQFNIYRNILCDSEDEWIEISAGFDDNKRINLCVQNNNEKTTIKNSMGYWHSFNAEDNHFFITMNYNASPVTPIIVKCMIRDWDQMPDEKIGN